MKNLKGWRGSVKTLQGGLPDCLGSVDCAHSGLPLKVSAHLENSFTPFLLDIQVQ